ECIEHHKSCDGNDLVELPTRVIDVGNTDTGQEPRLLLPERGAKGRYIALSHCWGLSSPTNPILRTEKETLAARIRGIPITSMPQNFIDAIIAARKLRIQFVWIDSLCIIQDSAEDWAREAAKMHNVYRNAFVTLAATSAQSSQDGFAHRSPSECRPAQYVEGSVWNTRGWTFQERLLSRRVLHFSETVVVFECRAGTISEDNRPSASNVNRTPWLEAEPLGIFIQTWQHLSLEKRFLMQWYILVDRYCIRQLTQKMDKLPALSGLAHEMAAFVGDEYLAGLWRRDLALGLLWNTVDRGDLQACETYRAPSWSWASIDGQI
ncbi:HET-domain-containing protein, partial [Glonium stellatum]